MWPFGRAHMTSYMFAFHKNYAFVLYRFREIASYLSKVTNVPHPRAFGAAIAGSRPHWDLITIFGKRKLECLQGYLVVLFA